MLLAAASASGASRVKKPQMKAESILGGLDKMKQDDEEEAEQRKAGAVDESSMRVTENDLKEYMDKDFDETDLEEYAKQFAEEEAADTTARQIRYELYPSKQYVLYLAKKNAIKTWTSDGPDGKNRGCLEVQIAIATEKIRNMILHMREFRKGLQMQAEVGEFGLCPPAHAGQIGSQRLGFLHEDSRGVEDSSCLPYWGLEESTWCIFVSYQGSSSSTWTQDLESFEEIQAADDSTFGQPASTGPWTQDHPPNSEEAQLPSLVVTTLWWGSSLGEEERGGKVCGSPEPAIDSQV